jgi:hypothetical protein
MAKLKGTQLSLITELGTDDLPVGDWAYDELGTNKFLVPNSPTSELGTNKFLVPNFAVSPIWEEKFAGRYLEEWKPPIGCLQQKWVKANQYWYWRYYDDRGKKASKYLAKDYTKAVRKAVKIGIPIDAKNHHPTAPITDIEGTPQTTDNLIDIAQTARNTPRTARAA